MLLHLLEVQMQVQKFAINLKKCVLELGGSDPFIVLDDAIIEKAAEGAVKGQIHQLWSKLCCIKKILCWKNIAKDFIELFIKKASQLKIGDPTSMDTDIGPLSSKDGFETISEIVEDAKEKGAEILLGGKEKEDNGYFYEPTILTNVKPNMRIAKEETFGPVAPITIVENESEAIKWQMILNLD